MCNILPVFFKEGLVAQRSDNPNLQWSYSSAPFLNDVILDSLLWPLIKFLCQRSRCYQVSKIISLIIYNILFLTPNLLIPDQKCPSTRIVQWPWRKFFCQIHFKSFPFSEKSSPHFTKILGQSYTQHKQTFNESYKHSNNNYKNSIEIYGFSLKYGGQGTQVL